MKLKSLYIVLFIFLSSCTYQLDASIEKPKDLIPQDTFTMVLKDIMTLESFYAIQGGDRKELEVVIPQGVNEIYKEHKIDSLRFAESMEYYGRKQNVLYDVYNAIQDSLMLEAAMYGEE